MRPRAWGSLSTTSFSKAETTALVRRCLARLTGSITGPSQTANTVSFRTPSSGSGYIPARPDTGRACLEGGHAVERAEPVIPVRIEAIASRCGAKSALRVARSRALILDMLSCASRQRAEIERSETLQRALSQMATDKRNRIMCHVSRQNRIRHFQKQHTMTKNNNGAQMQMQIDDSGSQTQRKTHAKLEGRCARTSVEIKQMPTRTPQDAKRFQIQPQPHEANDIQSASLKI